MAPRPCLTSSRSAMRRCASWCGSRRTCPPPDQRRLRCHRTPPTWPSDSSRTRRRRQVERAGIKIYSASLEAMKRASSARGQPIHQAATFVSKSGAQRARRILRSQALYEPSSTTRRFSVQRSRMRFPSFPMASSRSRARFASAASLAQRFGSLASGTLQKLVADHGGEPRNDRCTHDERSPID